MKNLGEECGVFAISGNPQASSLTVLGLHSMQHRGQEAVGIATSYKDKLYVKKALGLVKTNFFSNKQLEGLKGTASIGHVRYSTTKKKTGKNMHPFEGKFKGKKFCLAHNGHISIKNGLFKKIDKTKLKTSVDTEMIVRLIEISKQKDLYFAVKETIKELTGGFGIVILTEDGVIYSARDEFGIRPLVLGRARNGSIIVSSESCSIVDAGGVFERDIKPGEIVTIKLKSLSSDMFVDVPKSPRLCAFEIIYFGRPDSILLGKGIYEHRKNLGRNLAEEHPVKADMVVAVPDSALVQSMGYAEALKLPLEFGIVRNHYITRTFLNPTQILRKESIRLKFSPNVSVVKGKDIVLVDDSIVRGNTLPRIIAILKKAGVGKIHVRIASPIVYYRDYYGIDIATEKELIYRRHSKKGVKELIKADSLKHLSVDGMYRAFGMKKRDKKNPQLSDHIFTGEYPTEIKHFKRRNDKKKSQKKE